MDCKGLFSFWLPETDLNRTTGRRHVASGRHGVSYVAQRLHVIDHGPDLQGNAAFGHDFAQYLIHHHLFVAGGVEIVQLEGFKAAAPKARYGLAHALHGRQCPPAL